MKIAPIDIAHKTFSKKMMGLDAEEVMTFLRDVADQMEEIIRERNQLKEALRDKDLAIGEYRQRDDSLKATITTATRMSEQIRQDAEREAKLILNDAQQRGEAITRDARDNLKRIYQEINDLKRARVQFETGLRSMMHAHLSMLDQSHMVIPEIPTPTVTQAEPARTQPAAAQPVPLKEQNPHFAIQNHSFITPAPEAPRAATPAAGKPGTGPERISPLPPNRY